MANRESGLCDYCSVSNPFNLTHCKRCGEVLYWAFLLKPSLYSPKPAPNISWLVQALDLVFNRSGKNSKCRYCLETIVPEALVCPYCRRILFVGEGNNKKIQALGGIMSVAPRIDHENPSLKVLIENFLKEHPNGVSEGS
jgi:ribosomal protein S27E